MRRSKQLSYEATDVGNWSFVGSNEPVRNECEVIYEMFHIWNCGCEIKEAMKFAVMKAIYAIAYIEASTSLSAFQKSSFHPVMICNPIAYCCAWHSFRRRYIVLSIPCRKKKLYLDQGREPGRKRGVPYMRCHKQ